MYKNIEEFDFEKRNNHIMHSFHMCDSITLIYATHCESLYGCELLNYNKSYMSKLYV